MDLEIEGQGQTETVASAGREPGKGLRGLVKGPGFRLTARDYQIFGFLLDQKFASLEALYFRFFDGRKAPTDPLPENLYVARQRLGILKRAGLLLTERVYSDPRVCTF